MILAQVVTLQSATGDGGQNEPVFTVLFIEPGERIARDLVRFSNKEDPEACMQHTLENNASCILSPNSHVAATSGDSTPQQDGDRREFKRPLRHQSRPADRFADAAQV